VGGYAVFPDEYVTGENPIVCEMCNWREAKYCPYREDIKRRDYASDKFAVEICEGLTLDNWEYSTPWGWIKGIFNYSEALKRFGLVYEKGVETAFKYNEEHGDIEDLVAKQYEDSRFKELDESEFKNIPWDCDSCTDFQCAKCMEDYYFMDSMVTSSAPKASLETIKDAINTEITEKVTESVTEAVNKVKTKPKTYILEVKGNKSKVESENEFEIVWE
jgi:hypothetical protein